ncbi:MAG: hypothetical protein OEX03_03655 [Gammaproteobacteria bacterium]|nr:hypothetical protein [Gammaproteobacteria bacterium]
MSRLSITSASMLLTILVANIHANEPAVSVSDTAAAANVNINKTDQVAVDNSTVTVEKKEIPGVKTVADSVTVPEVVGESKAPDATVVGVEVDPVQGSILAVPVIATIQPESVTALMPIESGRNDSNPIWYKDGSKLSFERSEQGKKEILITSVEGELLQKIYVQSAGNDELAFLLPGITDAVSYNAGISWSPNGSQYVFMSNGGEGNYDLYLGNSENDISERLTEYEGKDGQAGWSPSGDRLVFVSGRSGSGDLFLLDMPSRMTTQLTNASSPFLYPEWSPNGKSIAVINGKNENHDIYLINDYQKPAESLFQLTSWSADDLRPMWSPDGKKIAFYTNYNDAGDSRIWSIVVVNANRTTPVSEEELKNSIVAFDVIPDIERGPAWLPDSVRIAYVKNSRQDYNPIYIASSITGVSAKLLTETRMNHDVSCSSAGVIAFRAQVEQWDQIYLAKMP